MKTLKLLERGIVKWILEKYSAQLFPKYLPLFFGKENLGTKVLLNLFLESPKHLAKEL
uniref:Uncharacterized protein n=1 Tax=viral metagenome TaxID=1070528 RepID=A0A6C0JXC0_9ZZZZ